MLKSPDRNDLDPYNSQYDVAIDLSSKLLRSKLISILFKIRDVVYVKITNISLASRLMCRSRSLTAVTSHRLAGVIRCTLSSDIQSCHSKKIENPRLGNKKTQGQIFIRFRKISGKNRTFPEKKQTFPEKMSFYPPKFSDDLFFSHRL